MRDKLITIAAVVGVLGVFWALNTYSHTGDKHLPDLTEAFKQDFSAEATAEEAAPQGRMSKTKTMVEQSKTKRNIQNAMNALTWDATLEGKLDKIFRFHPAKGQSTPASFPVFIASP